jgi:general secretion pathway protein D
VARLAVAAGADFMATNNFIPRQTMKNLIKYFSVAALLLFGGALASHAQQRTGGGGGGGGYGGFGGFGGGGGNRGFGGGYGSSSSSSSQYNNNGTVGSAMITVDPDTHNIIVIADAETAMQMSNVIANLDAPKPQVLIKVVFMEVDLNNSLDFGVQGGWGQQNGTIQQTAGSVMSLSGLGSATTNLTALGGLMNQGSLTGSGLGNATLPNGGLYQIAGSDFQATVRAIAGSGKAQILSRPSVLARDGQLAQIVVGQQIYLPNGVNVATGGTGSDVTTINGSYQNVGIILNVTPYIGDNGLVQMILQPETTSVDSTTQGQEIASGGLLGNPIFAPNLNVRIADTVVVTPDAQPVVIGGLIGDDKTRSDTKVPFLGDIPFLGNLFKYTSKSDTKNELLIFLTPHIVKTPSQLIPLSARETAQAQATTMTNSVSEQELDQYLERVPMRKH